MKAESVETILLGPSAIPEVLLEESPLADRAGTLSQYDMPQPKYQDGGGHERSRPISCSEHSNSLDQSRISVRDYRRANCKRLVNEVQEGFGRGHRASAHGSYMPSPQTELTSASTIAEQLTLQVSQVQLRKQHSRLSL